MAFFKKKEEKCDDFRCGFDINLHEKNVYETTKTNNDTFNKYGFIVIKNFWDPNDFKEDIDYASGRYCYDKFGKYTIVEEYQVPGSKARHSYPPYRYYHSQVRKKIEKILGNELFNTYYYDRVYYTGQELHKHADRDVCEISVTLQIGTNCKKKWPIWIKTPDTYDENKNVIKKGENVSISLDDGDAVIYMGCERPHWREPLKSRHNIVQKSLRKILGVKDDTYHHQVFFHYVLADGLRCSAAGGG